MAAGEQGQWDAETRAGVADRLETVIGYHALHGHRHTVDLLVMAQAIVRGDDQLEVVERILGGADYTPKPAKKAAPTATPTDAVTNALGLVGVVGVERRAKDRADAMADIVDLQRERDERAAREQAEE